MKVIIIFGPPGSGKGTQAELLCNKLNFLHFSTGAELRNEIAKKTDLGNKISEIISRGNLVTDELSTEITKNFIIFNINKDILLDGFPRTLNQAENLFKIIEELKIKNIQVINLEVKNEELIKRILNRAEIEHRMDDNLESVKQRLKIYNDQTKPILNFFKQKEISISNFNGEGNIEKIQEEIIKKIRLI